jgi:hypothetical protein
LDDTPLSGVSQVVFVVFCRVFSVSRTDDIEEGPSWLLVACFACCPSNSFLGGQQISRLLPCETLAALATTEIPHCALFTVVSDPSFFSKFQYPGI